MPRPVIGICAAVEPATFGSWTDEPAALVPMSYSDAIQRAGAIAVILPPDHVAEESPGELLDRIDALVIAGGADVDAGMYGGAAHPESRGTNPGRDRFEVALAREALNRDVALLGICRGMQVINVATGGTIEQHLPERLGHERHRPVPGQWAEHEVRLEPDSLAAQAAGAQRLSVKSHHHQGVDRLGDGFQTTGWAVDDETVEAIEHPGRDFALGVLWHPEEDSTDRIIPALVARARDRNS
jgi:putative glutamine amidotransferase